MNEAADEGSGRRWRGGVAGLRVWWCAMRGLAARRIRASCGQGLDGGSVAGGGAVCRP